MSGKSQFYKKTIAIFLGNGLFYTILISLNVFNARTPIFNVLVFQTFALVAIIPWAIYFLVSYVPLSQNQQPGIGVGLIASLIFFLPAALISNIVAGSYIEEGFFRKPRKIDTKSVEEEEIKKLCKNCNSICTEVDGKCSNCLSPFSY